MLNYRALKVLRKEADPSVLPTLEEPRGSKGNAPTGTVPVSAGKINRSSSARSLVIGSLELFFRVWIYSLRKLSAESLSATSRAWEYRLSTR